MSTYYELMGLRVEKSRSNSGKHVLNSTIYVYKKNQGLTPYTSFTVSQEPIKPTYAIGEAKLVKLRIEQGDFVIYVRFLRNFKRVVKGLIIIYNYKGEVVYRAKYINGFVVKSMGNPVYAWLVRYLLESLKIPYKSTKLGDEK